MSKFTRAIVRPPGRSMVHGLSSAVLGSPDYERAVAQHSDYVSALKECGLDVLVLESDEEHPDSTFIEDVALLTPECAIVTRPGAPSRRGETRDIGNVLKQFYSRIEEVEEPGTVEAGDIMMVDAHFYIGLSGRTNRSGAEQVISILEKYGMTGSTIHMKKVLHLKTGLAYLEDNNLVAAGEFLHEEAFGHFNIIEVDEDESYAANCIWVNGTVLLPAGYPGTRKKIETAGYKVREVDVSEFRRLDGGLSCLSLRF